MALNKARLGDLMHDAVASIGPVDDRKAYFRALAGAVIQHLTEAGEVQVVVTSVTGVTTGPGVSGPGTGTGKIT